MSRDPNGPYDFAAEYHHARNAKDTPAVRWIGGQPYDADDVPSESDLGDES